MDFSQCADIGAQTPNENDSHLAGLRACSAPDKTGLAAVVHSGGGLARQARQYSMILYNLFPLLAGPFSRWNEHFERAAGMHFDWVFINPIQQTGASCSLYSIADYFRFNPALLDRADRSTPEEQVRQMTTQAHQTGLKLMIDLVINHCAIDSRLTREHPEWFVRQANGDVARACCQNG